MTETCDHAKDFAPESPDTAAEPSTSCVEDEMIQQVIDALKTVHDPEIPLNIFDLGLIYRINVSSYGIVGIDMTLTAPGCPVAGEMVGWVEKAVKELCGAETVIVNLVFDPPWDQSMMTDAAKLELGLI